jgi:hypothetical protein
MAMGFLQDLCKDSAYQFAPFMSGETGRPLPAMLLQADLGFPLQRMQLEYKMVFGCEKNKLKEPIPLELGVRLHSMRLYSVRHQRVAALSFDSRGERCCLV